MHRVLLCDRRGKNQQGNKGDQHDADELSDLLRCGKLRAVYHGSAEQATLQDLARTYQNLVEDGTRVMQRLKAFWRRRACGSRRRHCTELAVLQELRPKAKTAMLAEARKDPAWAVLRKSLLGRSRGLHSAEVLA
ncbi:MAG: transposase [Gemmatimonadaceae bacterium]